ncbi:sulfite exporter TauE/SafE family protein [Catenovulum agarivorans]|uniref:sulfite exporter TauE/SafE family protein n=1 Tax=Catenovulum agarivorans TaxID=1172192 RepID=UPI0002E4F874|nr:sulfite exporter TauE/SafE family protein [Catenovulum agarivorans]
MPEFITAFILGLMGAGHCIAMCGGLAIASGINGRFSHAFLYSLGRITSYAFIGLLVGAVGFWLTVSFKPFLYILKILSALLLIYLALYIAKWNFSITKIEKISAKLWAKLAPTAQSLIKDKSYLGRFTAGAVWGWLPCGLVYSVLTWAAASANPFKSAALMFCFGLGTWPALLLSASIAQQMHHFLNKMLVRNIIAISLIAFAIYMLVTGVMQFVLS